VPVETSAGKILREAAELVDGPREVEHGDKRQSFDGIARAWNTYLTNKTLGQGEGGIIQPELTGYDVAQMMVLLKMTRPMFGQLSPDHAKDQCGYSGIAGMLAGSLPEPPEKPHFPDACDAYPGAIVYKDKP